MIYGAKATGTYNILLKEKKLSSITIKKSFNMFSRHFHPFFSYARK